MSFEEKLDQLGIDYSRIPFVPCKKDYRINPSLIIDDYRQRKDEAGIVLPCYFCNSVYFLTDDDQDEKFVNCDDCMNKAIRFHCT